MGRIKSRKINSNLKSPTIFAFNRGLNLFGYYGILQKTKEILAKIGEKYHVQINEIV